MTTGGREALIRLENISKTYVMGDNTLRALDGVSVSIDRGDFVAIVGPSGSGKSTLMHVIGLLDLPDVGDRSVYELGGQDVFALDDDALSAFRARSIGFIFQQFNLLSRTTATENVGLPMLYAGARYDVDRARELLQMVELGAWAEHRPNQLSGGQQQRVAIARSLVNNPPIILADEPTGNLDSRSEREILDILVRLNRAGMTVVIVTHEAEVTQVARRVIRLRDGKVVSDLRQEPRYLDGMRAADEVAGDPVVKETPTSETGAKALTRKAGNHVTEAWRAIRGNKMRSFLSILGILIGVAAVIAMLGLGEGAKIAMEKQLEGLGSNLLMIHPMSQRMRGMTGGSGATVRITEEDIAGLRTDIDHVVAWVPQVSGKAQVVGNGNNTSTQVLGVPVEYTRVKNAEPDVGRHFTREEDRLRSRVALLGRTVAKALFDGVDPIGQEIKINRVYFQVIGLLPEKGSTGWMDQDDIVVIPLQTAMKRVFGAEFVERIDAQVDRESNMDAAQESIRQFFLLRKGMTEKQLDDSLDIRNMAEIRNAISATSRIMSLLLAIIASISLVVGGIGVMNIMLVSVAERTREIGLRKALGATRGDIMAQFLVEAVVLSFVGGLLGVAIGTGIALAAATFTEWPFIVSTGAVTLVTLVTGCVGIVFGFWPARKAAGLTPIAALKYE